MIIIVTIIVNQLGNMAPSLKQPTNVFCYCSISIKDVCVHGPHSWGPKPCANQSNQLKSNQQPFKFLTLDIQQGNTLNYC